MAGDKTVSEEFVLAGSVQGGRGRASSHLLPSRFSLGAMLGGAVAPGTLNLSLPTAVRFDPAFGFEVDVGRWVWRARARGEQILLYRWAGCPLNVVEVVARENLRQAFDLRDGDSLDVALSPGIAIEPSAMTTAICRTIWFSPTGATYYSMVWSRPFRQGVERLLRVVQR